MGERPSDQVFKLPFIDDPIAKKHCLFRLLDCFLLCRHIYALRASLSVPIARAVGYCQKIQLVFALDHQGIVDGFVVDDASWRCADILRNDVPLGIFPKTTEFINLSGNAVLGGVNLKRLHI